MTGEMNRPDEARPAEHSDNEKSKLPERDDGYIPGSRNIPYRLVGEYGEELKNGKPVVTICESGSRAAIAASVLAAAGVDARPVLHGGIPDWEERGGATGQRLQHRGVDFEKPALFQRVADRADNGDALARHRARLGAHDQVHVALPHPRLFAHLFVRDGQRPQRL